MGQRIVSEVVAVCSPDDVQHRRSFVILWRAHNYHRPIVRYENEVLVVLGLHGDTVRLSRLLPPMLRLPQRRTFGEIRRFLDQR